MNRKLATVLNWLDAFRFPRDPAKFAYSISREPDGRRQVELNNLKVWLYFDQRRYWIAQGLDIGYVASARDIEAAKANFIRGLATTILINVEKSGSIDAIARPAPPEVWLAWRKAVRTGTPPLPKRVVSETRDVVPGLQAPAPKLDLSFYGCPA